ncbi:hypothetical protein, partial [Bifidobacterium pseudocatenulatum]|uniref:hypothetical protein n=1 Tax=Bifidobacterium pseudocatenulatum TaxID=28026 RepID=UPI003DA2E539
MAWLNPSQEFDGVACMEFLDSYLQGIADTNYGSGAFDTTTGLYIYVAGNTVRSISDGHIEFRIDNTFAGGRLSYLSLWVDGVQVNYLYSGALMTEFKLVMAVNEDDTGASYIGIYSLAYNQVQIHYYNSGITSYLLPYTRPAYTWHALE